MGRYDISRRRFLEGAAAAAGLAVVSSTGIQAAEQKKKRTAVDQVKLGKTGIKLSRLGIGVGSNGGNVQRALGHEGFNKLIRYAYDQGITYIDTADSYKTHTWVREAIKGLPREKLFIQSKMGGNPEKPLEILDRFRQELGMDYIDCVLSHCTVTPGWDEQRKRVLDALEEAKAKKIIRAHGVSCHSLPALKRSAEIDWVDVHLVRVNPQGVHMDTPQETWNAKSDKSHVPAVMEQLKIMRDKKRGVIGMKIIGEGDFTNPDDREKSIRFAMGCRPLNAVVIGFKSPGEIDEAILRMNNALAELS
ncbi:MAG: aldo/keto reductase [Sedimentisphaerales bacterium]|nr:aldo/keto reductase [Sedimentisphaerales bacterium]